MSAQQAGATRDHVITAALVGLPAALFEEGDPMMTTKDSLTAVNLKQALKPLYSPTAKAVQVVDVPRMHYLMIDGSGDPNTAQAYKDAVSALYSVAYTLKFAYRKREGIDYPVMPLEGLWWVDDLSQLNMGDKSNWQWTMMIVQPDVVTDAALADAAAEVKRKKNLAAAEQVRLAPMQEGVSAQILHIGPYAAEAPTIERLYAYMDEHGYVHNGKHHEIYLSDPGRTAPDKLKTIIRQPIARKAELETP